MLTLNLPKATQLAIEQQANILGISAEQLVTEKLSSIFTHGNLNDGSIECDNTASKSLSATDQPIRLVDFVHTLPKAEFKGDPLTIQRAFRDEWD